MGFRPSANDSLDKRYRQQNECMAMINSNYITIHKPEWAGCFRAKVLTLHNPGGSKSITNVTIKDSFTLF
jgi:hypothetical protein